MQRTGTAMSIAHDRTPTRRRSNRRPLGVLVAGLTICALGALGGCSGPSRLEAVPTELADQAVVLDNPAFRTWDSELNPAFWDEVLRAGRIEIDKERAANPNAELPTAYYLAISGGGSDGAFGMGLLAGWADAGTRPDFKIITGISAGAVTAPFIYLGPKWDKILKDTYTTLRTSDVAESRGLMGAIFNDALTDTTRMHRLMDRMLNEEMMQGMAAEYRKGRLLLIATSDLDADRGVIWNIGAIAASGHPGALPLIRQIILGSAAIPAAFPPIMIDVEVNGKKYQEMHVDGGARAQVFLYPPSLDLAAQTAAQGVVRKRVAYIIRNGKVTPGWADTERRTLPIAGRAISSLIQTGGIGDLYRLYLITQRDGVDYNLAYIPADFNVKYTEAFDPDYMAALYRLGYDAARAPSGYPWQKVPPGYKPLAHPAPTAP